MKFYLPLAFSLATLGLSSAALAAGTASAVLTIQGKVVASPCDLTLNNASLDLGVTLLGETKQAQTTFNITCFGPTVVALALADNSSGDPLANDPARPFSFYDEDNQATMVGSYGLSLNDVKDGSKDLTPFDNTAVTTAAPNSPSGGTLVAGYSFSADGSFNAAAVNSVSGTILLTGQLNNDVDQSAPLNYVGQTTLTVVNI